MLISAKDIMKNLEDGIQKHGILTFYEKGAPAIMDFSSIINQIRNMTMNDINSLFRELCDLGYVGEQFVYNAMIAMTDFFNPHTHTSNHTNSKPIINHKSEPTSDILDNLDLDSKKVKSYSRQNQYEKTVDEIEKIDLRPVIHSGNSVNLNAPTHNTDNILKVIQISQRHFELI